MPPRPKERCECVVPGCDRRAEVWDTCKAHYIRIREHGDPKPEIPIRKRAAVRPDPVTGLKFCLRCEEHRDASLFGVRADSPGALKPYCRPCESKICGDWNKRNPDSTYGAHLKRTYGITLGQYEEMVEAQGGACRICLVVPKKRLNVHHNHDTGEIVGLICWNCNTGLGKFKDNPALLRRAALFHEGKLDA